MTQATASADGVNAERTMTPDTKHRETMMNTSPTTLLDCHLSSEAPPTYYGPHSTLATSS